MLLIQMTMKNKELEIIGEPTEGSLKKWSKKYGTRLKRFEITDDGKIYVAYFAKPTLETVQAADENHGDKPVERNLFQLNNCYLGGSEVYEKDDEFRFALANAVAKSFRILTGVLKNG